MLYCTKSVLVIRLFRPRWMLRLLNWVKWCVWPCIIFVPLIDWFIFSLSFMLYFLNPPGPMIQHVLLCFSWQTSIKLSYKYLAHIFDKVSAETIYSCKVSIKLVFDSCCPVHPFFPTPPNTLHPFRFSRQIVSSTHSCLSPCFCRPNERLGK